MMDDGKSKSYVYDSENVLCTANNNGALLAAYKYGADNARLSESVTGQPTANYWYTGDQEIMETDANGAIVRRYIRLPSSVDETFLMLDYSSSPTQEVWVHTNCLGSTVVTTDETSAAIDRYTYDDYGSSATEGNAGFPVRFTGQKLAPRNRADVL